MRNGILLLLLLFLFSSLSFAGVDNFHKRFKLVRDDQGTLVEIRDFTITTRFSVAPYIDFIKRILLREQALMKSSGFVSYEDQVVALLNEENGLYSGDAEEIAVVVDALKALKDIDVEKIFSHPSFQEVINKYEWKLTEALSSLNPRVMARLDSPTYFYTGTVTYQVVKWALNFAKSRLSSIPILNTASFVIVQIEKMIRERRLFHQNMLMHYLQNHEEELGLTAEEVDYAFSSIYESRIPWYNFIESQAAQSNWRKYGVNRFFTNLRYATSTFRMNQHRYSSVGERLNFAFQRVTLTSGEDVIINLFDREAMFKNYPAIAYVENEPTKIARKRTLLQLAELGLSYVPVSSFVKNLVTNYIKSHYSAQTLTEGSLYAYFETQDDAEMIEDLRIQNINPYEKF